MSVSVSNVYVVWDESLHDLKELSLISNITVLTDPDLHNGRIFKRDGKNAYVAIILGHQEYATQKEYDNLKAYVYNGGHIVAYG
jgi:hypothetical protein